MTNEQPRLKGGAPVTGERFIDHELSSDEVRNRIHIIHEAGDDSIAHDVVRIFESGVAVGSIKYLLLGAIESLDAIDHQVRRDAFSVQ